VKKVLVVDDDPRVARLVAAALYSADVKHSLEYCSDGGQGRAKAAQGQYDLITLDLAMPFMDGVEALEEMKRNPRSADIPVVVITALQEPEVHKRAQELGAVAVITKPFELWELVNVFRLTLAGDQAKPPPGSRPSTDEPGGS